MDMSDLYRLLVGSGPEDIVWWQMMVRAVVIFVYGLFLIRIASNRAFGRATAVDLLLAVILGSVLSRALTANAELLPTMAAAGLIVAVHRLLGQLAFRWPWFARLIKGRTLPLMHRGREDRERMRRASVTRFDLLEAARTRGVNRLEDIEEAYLERSGEITVVPRR
jgi:uncharacterized membrane protein YcaP (DUF421 family)